MNHTSTTAGASADAGLATAGHDDALRTPGLTARSIAEGAGSFLVILVGLGATMLATETALQPTLVFGFAVIAAMIAFGHVSGGHFNPAITLASAVAGRTDWKAVVPYIVAQVLGAVAASGLIWLVLSANPQLTGIRAFFSSASNGYAEHSPVQFPLTSAFLLEVVATALLVAVFLGATSKRARRDLAPFAVGLTFAGLLSFLLPVTNGGINPVRATASAIFAETWALEQLWLFWAAPIIGGLIAGLVFRSVDSWGAPRPERLGVAASEAPASDVAVQQGVRADEQSLATGSPAGSSAVSSAGASTDASAGDAESFFASTTSDGRDLSSGDGDSGDRDTDTGSGSGAAGRVR
ncbi:aquaporin [Arthrobacter sp. NamB2]|uniref:aquaporin n=1 Tax=Arthrobacter sp. NamB2 TaxID=2576035 RepID=UPI001677E792|nr:aquaporin [Arthrobacter sp. NamB2]